MSFILVTQRQGADVPAITSLVLTSFRQFPLFDFLYSPLHENIDNAHDTVFFWSRRVGIAIYDKEATVMVAEVPSISIPPHSSESDKESCKMLRWATSSASLSQIQDSMGMTIVGFAVWRWKGSSTPRDKQSAYTTILQCAKKIFIDLGLRTGLLPAKTSKRNDMLHTWNSKKNSKKSKTVLTKKEIAILNLQRADIIGEGLA